MPDSDVEKAGAAERRPPTPAKRGVSIGAIIALAAGCAIVFPTLWYWKDLTRLYQLRAWSKAGPRQAVDRFGEALRAGDPVTIEGMLDGSLVTAVKSPEGTITGFKSKMAALAPAVSVQAATPSGSASGSSVRYRVADLPLAILRVPNAAGGTADFLMTRRGGRWLVAELLAY